MAAASYEITRDELREELDRQAKALLGISGAEFLDRFRKGALELDAAAVAHLAVFARLLND